MLTNKIFPLLVTLRFSASSATAVSPSEEFYKTVQLIIIQNKTNKIEHQKHPHHGQIINIAADTPNN